MSAVERQHLVLMRRKHRAAAGPPAPPPTEEGDAADPKSATSVATIRGTRGQEHQVQVPGCRFDHVGGEAEGEPAECCGGRPDLPSPQDRGTLRRRTPAWQARNRRCTRYRAGEQGEGRKSTPSRGAERICARFEPVRSVRGRKRRTGCARGKCVSRPPKNHTDLETGRRRPERQGAQTCPRTGRGGSPPEPNVEQRSRDTENPCRRNQPAVPRALDDGPAGAPVASVQGGDITLRPGIQLNTAIG